MSFKISGRVIGIGNKIWGAMHKIVPPTLALLSVFLWHSPLRAAPDCNTWLGEEFWQNASAEDVSRCLTGANLEARDDTYGATPLDLAAWRSTPEAIKALLDAGADASARDSNGNTPLDRVKSDLRKNLGVEEVFWRLNDATTY